LHVGVEERAVWCEMTGWDRARQDTAHCRTG